MSPMATVRADMPPADVGDGVGADAEGLGDFGVGIPASQRRRTSTRLRRRRVSGPALRASSACHSSSSNATWYFLGMASSVKEDATGSAERYHKKLPCRTIGGPVGPR